ncbi:MAG TPA: hypothetical protein VL197_02255 [Nitrospirota bacterium]|nr:hypothetical protein [Nitrospirota bacterium]
MKKIMMLVMVVMLMLGVSGQAMAAFSDGDLIRVVYSTAGTNEVATDLGSIANLTSASSTLVNFNTNNFNFASLGAGANASNSYVVYYSLTLSPNPKNQAWLSGPAGGQTTAKSSWTSFSSAAHTVNGQYQLTGGGSSQVTLATNDPNSFYQQLEGGGSLVGYMKGFIPTSSSAIATASLANLATNGYVDQVLYYYGLPSGINGTSTGLNVSTIRTMADGSTVLNPGAPATPIPAAAYLFGSGLLGLVGLRRKMAA